MREWTLKRFLPGKRGNTKNCVSWPKQCVGEKVISEFINNAGTLMSDFQSPER